MILLVSQLQPTSKREKRKEAEELLGIMAFKQIRWKFCLVFFGIMGIFWWGSYEINLWEGYKEVAPEEIATEDIVTQERLFRVGSSQLMLPQRLQDRLTNYLGGDVCHRWDTPEDGEDLFRLFLEVTFHANDQNVSQEEVTGKILGVSEMT